MHAKPARRRAASPGVPPPAEPSDSRQPASTAFLLAQVGADAALRFAEQLKPHELAPAHAGILRLISREPNLNQKALAERLGAMPSRVVALIDELETRGLVTRHRREDDRRSHVLRLTAQGHDALAAITHVARKHDADMTAALTEEERRVLHESLTRIAVARGLAPGVHPGYGTLRRPTVAQ